VLHRLPEQIDPLKPDVVLVWCGADNSWNVEKAEDDVSPATWEDRMQRSLMRLRLYKLWRVWVHQEKIVADIAGQQFGDRLEHQNTGIVPAAHPGRRLG
jgi:hypothetical protein